MVCTRKSKALAAAATAASSFYGGYNTTVPTATPVPSSSSFAQGAQPNAAAVASGSSGSSAAAVSAANSGIKGFNYGAFFLDQQAKVQNDFEYEFKKAQNLANTTGWTSARLYTTGESMDRITSASTPPPPLCLSRDVDLPHDARRSHDRPCNVSQKKKKKKKVKLTSMCSPTRHRQ
jgi:hypothetical protein